MNALIAVSLSFLSCSVDFEYSTEQIAEIEQNFDKWKAIADAASTIPRNDAIEKLSIGLRATSTSKSPFGDRIGTHQKIRDSLLSLGGYGDYWSNRISRARTLLNEGIGDPGHGERQAALRSAQVDGFFALGLLPSAESIRVLGEFLVDEEGMVPKIDPQDPRPWTSRQYEQGISPNSVYALAAIAKLPLVSKPVQSRKGNFTIYDDDIEAWRLWYEQVKSGKRTFQFEGDPQVYSLSGPIQEARVPRDEGSSITTQIAVPESSDLSPGNKGSPSAWPLVGAGLLLASAIWLATRQKASKAG